MGTTPLEESIREESRKAIDAAREAEASRTGAFEEECDAEIARFRERTEEETRARIRQEAFKLKNRSILERKKRRLTFVEEFITGIVEDAVAGIGKDRRYGTFLADTVVDAATRLQGSLEVGLREEDLVRREEIMEALTAAGKEPEIVITRDDGIRWGGCIVRDLREGRILNSTIERIYYRKSPAVRRAIMGMLKEKGLAIEE